MRDSQENNAGGEPKNTVAEDLIRQISESMTVRNVVSRKAGRRALAGPGPLPPGILLEPAVPAPQPPAAPAVCLPEAPAPLPPAPVEAPVPLEHRAAEPAPLTLPSPPGGEGRVRGARPLLAVFCFHDPDCAIGRYVARTMPLLAARQTRVHVFSRKPFNLEAPGVQVHVIGGDETGDLLADAQEFAERALAGFEAECAAQSQRVTALGFEWVSVKLLVELEQMQQAAILLSLHSLEAQRSNMSSELSRTIQAVEAEGLAKAQVVLVHNAATAGEAAKLVPECQGRLVQVAEAFPIDDFCSGLDAGAVKARFQVGPVDPTVLFVGELDERHGPDIIMKAAQDVLKKQPQVRFVFVGDGPLLWPLRVHTRYLQLEHAVRIVGHLAGKALYELIEAADIVCVPSRDSTEDWPILAAWAARRPVLATHNVGGKLIQHEQDGVLIYPSENSCVWGIERVLRDEDLRQRLRENGHQKLLARCGWGQAAAQLEELMSKR